MSGLANKLININRRYVFLATIIILAITVIKPLSIPISISAESRKFYQEVEKLEQDDVVLIWVMIDPAATAYIGYPTATLIKQIFRNDAKVLIASSSATTAIILLPCIEDAEKKFDKEMGVDWVMYPFIPGGEAALAAFAANLHVTETDYFGNSLEDLPLLSNLNDVNDLQLAVGGSTEQNTHQIVIRQIQQAYGIKTLDIVSAASYPTVAPYVQSGQFSAVIKGARAAAEYEQVSGLIGLSSQSMASQFYVQGFFLVLGICYLIADYLTRKPENKEVRIE
jgi:hypothetical protein